ncbi:MAG TPA: DNA-binding protein [Cyanobacteria bacterium UBA11372]|nr:DNA-binding protein [Cyanobacteria bacterium UBA11372]HBE36920.1 DNA-binding protein [Cyanobacteria bacterium UBA11368]HBE51755.1 DNA-binding protein [Cyanobacteria bacterium UBA11369]
MKIFALRLKPEQDLKKSLKNFVLTNNIEAGFILTAVGSLQQATIRFANQNESHVLLGKFEIVSLVGTLSVNGIHLHISIADSEGITRGGHLVDGCLIYTTAEIVIGESEDLIFSREVDKQTGYLELAIYQKS